MTELRSKARNNGVYLRVVKNTLARRAVEGTEFECMKDGMVDPLVLAFSKEDPSSAARLMKDFAKGHDKMVVKVGSFGGKVLSAQELDKLATMPTRDQALSMLMAVMKAPVAKLARTIAAVRDQKQATAPGLPDRAPRDRSVGFWDNAEMLPKPEKPRLAQRTNGTA